MFLYVSAVWVYNVPTTSTMYSYLCSLPFLKMSRTAESPFPQRKNRQGGLQRPMALSRFYCLNPVQKEKLKAESKKAKLFPLPGGLYPRCCNKKDLMTPPRFLNTIRAFSFQLCASSKNHIQILLRLKSGVEMNADTYSFSIL